MSLNIGAAKCKVDLRQAIEFNMQGFADEDQKATRIGMDFYSRAFTIADDHHGRVAIAVVDLWACTESIKKEVVARIDAKTPGGHSLFNIENVQVVGTHTHSGPAGISEYSLYNFSSGGFKKAIRDAYADAIAQSIFDAFKGEGSGDVILRRINVEDCGRNRSAPAYLNNPEEERRRYGKDTDTEMVVLEFVKRDKGRIGILSWYPIHGTDLGQVNTALHGDNKGIASQILEQEQKICPVAAFANANAGDVSGNVEFKSLPTADTSRARKHGKQQADAVISALNQSRFGDTAPAQVACQYSAVDMSNVTIASTGKRTYVPTLGLSMFAGSPADSTPPFITKPLSPGLVRGGYGIKEAAIQALLVAGGSKGDINRELMQYIAGNNRKLADALVKLEAVALQTVFAGLEVVRAFKGTPGAPSFSTLTEAEKAGHDPKPITMVAKGIVPSRLPLQLMRIGDLVIAGVPGEMTTMAGRRLKAALRERYDALRPKKGKFSGPVRDVVVSGYANAYSQYITTPEEYAKQYYEGASTLFGPHTLDAYIQEFCKLVPSS